MIKLRARFKKADRAKYISHLDLYRLMQRAFKRAHIAVWYTEGYNPHLYIMFPLPLSLGSEGECEIMDFSIIDENLSTDYVKERLNSVLPEGIEITDLYEPVMKHTEIAYSLYDVFIISNDENFTAESFDRFISQKQIVVQKKTKQNKIKETDIKPLIEALAVENTDTGIFVKLKMPSGSNNNFNPSLLLGEYYKFIDNEPEFVKLNRKKIITMNGEEFR